MEFPSEMQLLTVELLCQDGELPFVCGVVGCATADAINEIEREAGANTDEMFTRGDGSYLFRATWEAGQYGDEGRCEIAPYWDLELLAFKKA